MKLTMPKNVKFTEEKKYSLPKKPIDIAYEKIAELKIMLKSSTDIQKKMLVIILEMQTKIDKLEKTQCEEIKKAEKSREGWIF